MVMAVAHIRPGLPVGHPLMHPNSLRVRRALNALALPSDVERVSFLAAAEFGQGGLQITLVVTMKSGAVLRQGMSLTDALLQNGHLRAVLEAQIGEMISCRRRASL